MEEEEEVEEEEEETEVFETEMNSQFLIPDRVSGDEVVRYGR